MKKVICLLLSLVLCLSLSAPAFAAVVGEPEEEDSSAYAASDNQTRLEETEWYYRITESGLIQRRLWSITYGYWKTDWITIGHV